MAPKKKAQQAASTKPLTSPQPVRQLPNWPAFTHLIPEADQALNEMVQGQIVTIPNFWTATLCKTYVSFLSSLPFTTTPGKPKKGDAVRVNDRFQIDDAAFAERLWSETALKSLVTGTAEEGALGLTEAQRKELWGGDVVGLNPNIRIYRYSKGQFFDQHCMSSPRSDLSARMSDWIALTDPDDDSNKCDDSRIAAHPNTHHLDITAISHFSGHRVHRRGDGILPGSAKEEEQRSATRTDYR